jgi:tRNA dimethylallyltransferase
MPTKRPTKKILILGLTGAGKGAVAFELAKRTGGQILSIDSMKVYRRMDIGTAKPPLNLRQQVTYHMIDVVEPWDAFSAGRFVAQARPLILDLEQRGIPLIAVGGTALYIKALLYGIFDGPPADPTVRGQLHQRARTKGLEVLYAELARVDPQAASRIHPTDLRRITRALEVYALTGRPISSFQTQFDRQVDLADWAIVGLRRDRQDQAHRINARIKRMIENGLLEEVKGLLADPRGMSPQARSAIGYAEVIDHIEGRIDLERTIELIKRRTRRLAKAQRTWFKTFRFVQWLDVGADEPPDMTAQRILESTGLDQF